MLLNHTPKFSKTLLCPVVSRPPLRQPRITHGAANRTHRFKGTWCIQCNVSARSGMLLTLGVLRAN